MNVNDYINRLVRPEVRQLTAYHVPDPGKMIKLDAMENPYALPEELRADLSKHLKNVAINRYPDPSAAKVVDTIKTTMNIPDELGVLLGNGSDELILLIMLALAGKGKSILAPTPTFVMYKISALTTGYDFIDVPLADDFSLNMPQMIDTINKNNPAIIFLAHPNNPTGNNFSKNEMIEIIETAKGVVVIDEAYFPFADYSFLNEVDNYDNVLLLRTVSKMGMAGLRLGFLVAKPEWIEQIDKVRLPYNINVLTQITIDFVLNNKDILDQQTKQICLDRELLKNELVKIDDLVVFPSQANFLLFKVPKGMATDLFEHLKSDGILIKNMTSNGGMLVDCLRVTVGASLENNLFIKSMNDFFNVTHCP